MHILFEILFIGYYKILGTVPLLCSTSLLVICFTYGIGYILIPKGLI